VDEPVMMVSGAGTKHYFHQNHLYSVAAMTSSAGAVVERYRYDAYGKRTVTNVAGAPIATSAIGQQRGFTGYHLDAETGLYYARARMYSAGLGRFIGKDPIGYINGHNLFQAYFAPNGLDPMGLAVFQRTFDITEQFIRRVIDENFIDLYNVREGSADGYYYYWTGKCCEEFEERVVMAIQADRNGRRSYDLYMGGTLTVEIETGLTSTGTALGWAGVALDAYGMLNGPGENVTDVLALAIDLASVLGDYTEVSNARVIGRDLRQIRRNETNDGISLTNFRLNSYATGSFSHATGAIFAISESACAQKDTAARALFNDRVSALRAEMEDHLSNLQ